MADITAAGAELRRALAEHFFDRDFELGKYSAQMIAERVIKAAECDSNTRPKDGDVKQAPL